MLKTFFEITSEDFRIVTSAHGIILSDDQAESLARLDESLYARLLDGVDNLTRIDAQTTAVHANIEEFLMATGVVPKGESKFALSDEDDDDEDEDEDDDDDEDDLEDEYDDDDDEDEDDLEDEYDDDDDDEDEDED